jgi:hypothetical protein
MAVVDLRPSAPCARRRRRRTHRDCGGARRHATQKVTHNARIGEGSVLPVRRRWGGSPSAASSPPAPPALRRLACGRVQSGRDETRIGVGPWREAKLQTGPILIPDPDETNGTNLFHPILNRTNLFHPEQGQEWADPA